MHKVSKENSQQIPWFGFSQIAKFGIQVTLVFDKLIQLPTVEEKVIQVGHYLILNGTDLHSCEALFHVVAFPSNVKMVAMVTDDYVHLHLTFHVPECEDKDRCDFCRSFSFLGHMRNMIFFCVRGTCAHHFLTGRYGFSASLVDSHRKHQCKLQACDKSMSRLIKIIIGSDGYRIT